MYLQYILKNDINEYKITYIAIYICKCVVTNFNIWQFLIYFLYIL